MNVYRSKKMGQAILRTYDTLVKQWDVAVEEMDIETIYGSTHVIACGDKKLAPLVLFHGVGDDSALMWIYNAKYLSQYYRVYAVDTIGGPGKSVPGKRYDKEFDDVLWIDEVLQGLGLDKAYFAGVSMGGFLVKLYAVARPEKMIKGISISGALSVERSESKKSMDQMTVMMKIFLPEALFPTKKNVLKLIKKLSGENYGVFTDNADIMEHYTYLLRGFNNMAMGYHKVRPFKEEEVGIIREKVEFLAGLEDPFETMGGADILKEYQMKVTFYPGAGHGLNHEKADEINAKIVEILERGN